MFKSLVFDPKRGLIEDLSIGKAASYLNIKDAVIWLDFFKPTDEELNSVVERFELDPHAVEEIKTKYYFPRVLFYERTILAIWYAVVDKPKTTKLEVARLEIFLGPNFMLTIHQQPLTNLDELRELCAKDHRLASNKADWLLFFLLDSLVDDIFPLLDRITEEINQLEDDIFRGSTPENLKALFMHKRQLLTLRKVITPEREVVNLLMRHGSRLIRDETFLYFQDVYDHLLRIVDSIDTARDVISGAMDIYLSSVSNRMNEVMKKLTVVATVFMPLTFIVGVYGMNFKYMPEINQPWGYYAVWGFIIVLAIGMLVYFRIKEWW